MLEKNAHETFFYVCVIFPLSFPVYIILHELSFDIYFYDTSLM